MPKNITKFGISLQNQYLFLKSVDGSESEVFCSLCKGRFSVAKGGITRITDHLKHNVGTKTVENNQPIISILANDSAQQLQGKELAFAFHSGKHGISSRTADCNSKLVCFDSNFSSAATKTSKLVQKVDSNLKKVENFSFQEFYRSFHRKLNVKSGSRLKN